jgi:hypothetical protein
MSLWKDEDIATPNLIKEYLQEFREGITHHSKYDLNKNDQAKVQDALCATEEFCAGLLSGKKGKLYMHDLVLMAIGFYGGYLSALDGHPAVIKKSSDVIQ